MLPKHPRETDKAFAAFQVFIALGRDRTLQPVMKKVGKSIALIQRWSRKHQWFARAREHDAALEKAMWEAEQKNLAKTANSWAGRMEQNRQEAWSFSQALKAKAKALLEWPIATTKTKDGLTTITPARWTFADAARMIDVAQKLGNLAVGAPTEHHEVTGPNGGPVALAAPAVVFYIPENGRDKPAS